MILLTPSAVFDMYVLTEQAKNGMLIVLALELTIKNHNTDVDKAIQTTCRNLMSVVDQSQHGALIRLIVSTDPVHDAKFTIENYKYDY